MKRPITPRGYNLMRQELRRLRSQRPELAKAIEVARGHGDLSENGDYDAAKERSGMVEAKIRDLEAKLGLAELIDPRKLPDPTRVTFGVSARIVDLDTDEKRTLCIVGADESNVERGLISLESPLGRALIGKEPGDSFRVELPGGPREYEVLEVFVDKSIFEEGADDGADETAPAE
ncbi:MAG: transcription elongation factor GreA [Bdellovibrionota bacterium]|nr:MAG: transcription elongation factor GreA [Bdellovibrionota bacterium]